MPFPLPIVSATLQHDPIAGDYYEVVNYEPRTYFVPIDPLNADYQAVLRFIDNPEGGGVDPGEQP